MRRKPVPGHECHELLLTVGDEDNEFEISISKEEMRAALAAIEAYCDEDSFS